MAMTPASALAFFASVIRSGEPWTPICQQAMDEAMAHLTQLAQSVGVADVRLLLEYVAEDHGGDRFEADCRYCAAVDRLAAALQEKGNG